MRPLLVTVAIASAVALSLGACTSPDGSKPNSTGTPVAGGILNIGVSADLVKTIPQTNDQTNSRSIASHMFNQLVTANGADISPSLAESYTVSDDGREYVFDIRTGVTFHDGSPMTAEDVLWSLEFARTAPFSEALLKSVGNVELDGDGQLVITLNAPQPDFLQVMAQPAMSVLPKDFGGMDEAEFAANPIGTGPFMWEEHVPGSSVTLKRFDAYWDGPVYLDGVEFKVFGDINAQSLALQSGDVDLLNNVPLDALDIMQGEVVAVSVPKDVTILMMNSTNEFLADPDIRRALALGLDRDSIVAALLEGHGRAATTVLQGAAFPLGVPDLTDSPYVYDPEKAQSLVENSKYDGTPIPLMYSTGLPFDVALAQVMASQYEQIGLNIELQPLDSNAWLSNQSTKGDHWSLSISSKTGGQTATDQLSFAATSEYMWGTWSTEDIDAAIAAFNSSTSPEEAQSVLVEWEESVADHNRIIPITHQAVVFVKTDRLHGFEPGASQYYDLSKVWLQK